MKITIGIVIALVGLWGGSYCALTLPSGHWAIFPTIVTGVLMVTAGITFSLITITEDK